MEALVSVVVPVYNVEAWLNRCIDSLISQTYENLEILLVDDGSTDRSGEICDHYATVDPRVRVLHQSNAGLSAARNAGTATATGLFVTFVDSDDWVHPDFVARLCRMLDGRTDAIAATRFRRVTEGQPFDAREGDDVLVLPRAEALAELVGRQHVLLTVAWGKLYPRQLLDGLQFPVGRAVEDEFTTYRIIARATEVRVTSAEMYYYWQRADSLMGLGYNLRAGLDAIEAYRQRAEFLSDLRLPNVSREAYRQLYRRQLRLYRWFVSDDKRRRAAVLTDMRSALAQIRDGSPRSIFDLFAAAYVRAPRAVDPLYRVYLRSIAWRRARIQRQPR